MIAITDASGASIATNSYDEYGIPRYGNQGRFQFTGQKWFSNIGLYDFKARMYSPTLGRFTAVGSYRLWRWLEFVSLCFERSHQQYRSDRYFRLSGLHALRQLQ